jgi:hypothetical protein
MWCCLTVGRPKEGRPNVLKSRDARTPEITGANAGDLRELDLPFSEGTVLVGELEAASQWAKEQVEKNGYRRMFLFDIVRSGMDADLRDFTTYYRYDVLKRKVEVLSNHSSLHRYFPLVPYHTENFRALYDLWIDMGYEGVVLKRLDSIYRTARLDGKTDLWLRCKKHVTGDYVLMGVGVTPGGKTKEPGPIGLWGLYSHGELQQVMRGHCDPQYYDEKYFGRIVAEFVGWEKFKSGSLRHAQFLRWREDKSPDQCVLNGPEDMPGFDAAQATKPDNDLTGEEF